MKWPSKRWWLKPLVLLAIILLIHLITYSPVWIEKYYSTGLYPYLSGFLRACTGWIPFSLGDIIYTLTVLWLVGKVIHFFARGKITWKRFGGDLLRLLNDCLFIYIWFLLAWGLNYYRIGLSNQIGIKPDKYSTADLKATVASLVQNINTSKQELMQSGYQFQNAAAILKQATDCYTSLEAKDSSLYYHYPSIKKTLYGKLGNYAGYLGYYNPFTGEAQVNAAMPVFVLPFTACHEIAHQCGYASENEASFTGYLAIKASGEKGFVYSAYFDLFLYANAELFHRDSLAARSNYGLLLPDVRKDLLTYRRFLTAYQNPVEPYLTKLYSTYLKAHNQPLGIDSYDEVVAWLVAYYKRYGTV